MSLEVLDGDTARNAPETADPVLKRLRNEVARYESEFDAWLGRSRAIVKRYRNDEQNVTDPWMREWSRQRFNVLWSNTQIIWPTLYLRTPKPDCERKYLTANPLHRLAAEILERVAGCVVKTGSADDSDYDVAMSDATLDLLLPGRGTVWATYDPTIEQVEDEFGGKIDAVVDEKTRCDFVPWYEFGHNVARSWGKVTLVWRKVYLSKKEFKKYFPDYPLTDVNFSHDEVNIQNRTSENNEVEDKGKKACVYECWDKEERKVYWFAQGGRSIIKELDDPLKLANFFPCPRPMFASLTNDSLKPIADFYQYQSQADELDELCMRREIITRAIRVVGGYPSSITELQNILDDAGENEMVPINNWQAIQEMGGVDKLLQFIPIEQLVKALQIINVEISNLKNEIYEITGISEIMRGYSPPTKTATAVSTELQSGTVRNSKRKKDVARFARDTMALLLEIAIEHFSDEKIFEIANMGDMSPEEQAMFPQALALLRDDKQRKYQIDIETDSMNAENEAQERQDRMQVVQVYGDYFTKFLQTIENNPNAAIIGPAFSKIAMFAMRSFKNGRELEYMMEKTMDALLQKTMQDAEQGPPPDPQMAKVQMDAQHNQMKLQAETQKNAADNQLSMMTLQAQSQKDATDAALKAKDQELQEYKLAIEAQDLRLKEIEMFLTDHFQREKLNQDTLTKIATARPREQNGARAS